MFTSCLIEFLQYSKHFSPAATISSLSSKDFGLTPARLKRHGTRSARLLSAFSGPTATFRAPVSTSKLDTMVAAVPTHDRFLFSLLSQNRSSPDLWFPFPRPVGSASSCMLNKAGVILPARPAF